MNQQSKFQIPPTNGLPVYSPYRPVVQKDKYEIEFLDERFHNDQLSPPMEQPSLLTKMFVTCLAVIVILFCLYKLFIKP